MTSTTYTIGHVYIVISRQHVSSGISGSLVALVYRKEVVGGQECSWLNRVGSNWSLLASVTHCLNNTELS